MCNVERQFAALLSGEFLQRAENVLVFGSPGGGKTHLLAALGHELIGQGRSVYFATCVLLVQKLLAAKQDLLLERELKRLDKYEALIIDDIGHDSRIVKRWKCSSHCWLIAMNGAACC